MGLKSISSALFCDCWLSACPFSRPLQNFSRQDANTNYKGAGTLMEIRRAVGIQWWAALVLSGSQRRPLQRAPFPCGWWYLQLRRLCARCVCLLLWWGCVLLLGNQDSLLINWFWHLLNNSWRLMPKIGAVSLRIN
jgi:hypothetical protein